MSKHKFSSTLISLISDIRFSLTTLFLSILLIASATFIEKILGHEAAFDYIYHNSALYLLFGIMIVGFIAMAIKLKLIKRKRYGTIFIHLAFGIIIIGAVISHFTSQEGTIHLREGETSSEITFEDSSTKSLSYSVTLNRFDIEYYEGNEFPLAYKSFVTINDGDNVYEATIAVNDILRIKGDRIYQLSYDEDKNGSTLLINNDYAGTLITYIGYILLLYGFVLSLFGDNGRIKDILKSISSKGGKIAIITVLLSASASINAASLRINENNLIPEEDAKKWETVFVLSNNGIIEPLECHARTILRKITHSNGSDDKLWGARLYMSFIVNHEEWCNSPIIYCPDEDIKRHLDGKDGKYISFNSLFNIDGAYKLNYINSANLDSKEIKKLDERARIFSAIINCSLLKIFPTEDGRWVAPDNNVFSGKDSLFVASAINSYIYDKAIGATANDMIDHIAGFQEMKYKGTLPSPTKSKLSIIYSKAPIFKISAFGYIIFGVLLFFFALKYSHAPTFMQQIKMGALMGGVFALFLLHSSGILLRWYVSEQAPWSNTYETMLYIAWCMVLAGLLFMKRSYIVFALSSIMAAVTLFISSLNWLDPVITPLMPVLNSPWLILHVTVITASYGFFGICAIIGTYTLVISFKKNSPSIIKELTEINEFLMYIGLTLVTIGTFLGAVWANISWGRYWGWDAKESWALITIFVYAIVTHIRLIPKLKNEIIFSALSIIASLSVLMTYFGVNYYLSGLHSYGNNDAPPAVEYIVGFYIFITFLSVCAYFKHRENKKN